MRYNQYYPIDVLNGPGTRCTLFVSGCEHQCRGCYNQSTWSLDSGVPFTQELSDQIIADLQDTKIKRRGLSLSGGDPLHPANLADVLEREHNVISVDPDISKKAIVCIQRMLDFSAEQKKAKDREAVLTSGMGAA